jgi:hypothetical protein
MVLRDFAAAQLAPTFAARVPRCGHGCRSVGSGKSCKAANMSMRPWGVASGYLTATSRSPLNVLWA